MISIITVLIIIAFVLGFYLSLTGDFWDFERGAIGLLFIIGGLILSAFKLGQWLQ